MTALVAKEVRKVTSVKELEIFLKDNHKNLGVLHNTAYYYFNILMNTLRRPTNAKNEKAMPDCEIAETYFYRKLIKKNKNISKDKFQKVIVGEWPDNTVLSKMSNRRTDVSRTALILLFVATDGGKSDLNPDTFAEKYPDTVEKLLSANERIQNFNNVSFRLNLMLNRCGFPILDARNLFDWMILYCLCVDDIVDTDGRIAAFLKELFPQISADFPAQER